MVSSQCVYMYVVCVCVCMCACAFLCACVLCGFVKKSICVCVGEFGSSVVTMKRPLLTPFMLSGSLSITFAAVRLSSALEQRQCYKDRV